MTQAMPGAHQDFGLDLRADHRLVGDAEFDLAIDDAGKDLRRRQRLQRHAHLRAVGDEGRDRLGQVTVGDRKRGGDRHGAEPPAGQILGQSVDPIDPAEDRGDFGKYRVGFRGRLQPSGNSRKQLHVELALAMLEHCADRRLRDIERASGSGHGASPHNGVKHFHVPQVHHTTPKLGYAPSGHKQRLWTMPSC
jgi:hypothetical protein